MSCWIVRCHDCELRTSEYPTHPPGTGAGSDRKRIAESGCMLSRGHEYSCGGVNS